MCQSCNYLEMLKQSDVGATPHRVKVLATIGNSDCPLRAQEIIDSMNKAARRKVNRVTVYRILDLLVEHGLVDRISTGDRTFRYGLAPNDHHKPHPHFYCTKCGRMRCMSPDELGLDAEMFARTCKGRIEKVEIRLDGICSECLKQGDWG